MSSFRDDLDAQAKAQNALRDRIEDLEAAIGAAGAQDEQALTGLDERLAELSTTLADLSGKIDGEVTAREDADAEALAALSNLESVLGTLQTSVETLREQLQQLQDDQELLRAQFDNHVEDHSS